MNSKNLPLRPNVCMLVFNKERKLWLGEREGSPGVWQFPQGGAKKSLSLEENVLRELEEELGVNRADLVIIGKLEATHEYEFRDIPSYAIGKWRGQSQTFWLVEFTGSDSAIDLEAHQPEFSDWRWCTPAEVRELAEPQRMTGYRAPLEEFEKYVSSAT